MNPDDNFKQGQNLSIISAKIYIFELFLKIILSLYDYVHKKEKDNSFCEISIQFRIFDCYTFDPPVKIKKTATSVIRKKRSSVPNFSRNHNHHNHNSSVNSVVHRYLHHVANDQVGVRSDSEAVAIHNLCGDPGAVQVCLDSAASLNTAEICQPLLFNKASFTWGQAGSRCCFLDRLGWWQIWKDTFIKTDATRLL